MGDPAPSGIPARVTPNPRVQPLCCAVDMRSLGIEAQREGCRHHLGAQERAAKAQCLARFPPGWAALVPPSGREPGVLRNSRKTDQ